MDITKPPIRQIEDIDKHLERLEEETRIMKEKFGFEGINEAQSLIAIKRREKAATQPKKYNDDGKFCMTSLELRFNYDTLVEVIPESKPPKPILLRPEISAEWVAANKITPDLKVFYDKNRFEKQVFRTEDFVLTKDSPPNLEAYDEYMSHYFLLN